MFAWFLSLSNWFIVLMVASYMQFLANVRLSVVIRLVSLQNPISAMSGLNFCNVMLKAHKGVHFLFFCSLSNLLNYKELFSIIKLKCVLLF